MMSPYRSTNARESRPASSNRCFGHGCTCTQSWMVDRALERILRLERSETYSENSDGWYSRTEGGSATEYTPSDWEGASSVRSSGTESFSARPSREPPRGRSRERRPRSSGHTSSQHANSEPPLEPIKAGDLPMVVRTATVQTDASKRMSRSRSARGGHKHQAYRQYRREGPGHGSVDGDSYSSSGDSVSSLSSLETSPTNRFSRSPTPDNSRAIPWSWNARNTPRSRYPPNPTMVGQRDLGDRVPVYRPGIPRHPTPGYDLHARDITDRSYPVQRAVGHPPVIHLSLPHYGRNHAQSDYISSTSASGSLDGYDGSSDEGFFDDEDLSDAGYFSSSGEEYSDGDLYYD